MREGQRMSLEKSRSLFLIAMNENRIRQYAPEVNNDLVLFVEQHEPLFQVVDRIISSEPLVAPPVLDTRVLSGETIRFFRSRKTVWSEFGCTCVDDAETFVDWLFNGKVAISRTSEEDRMSLLSHIQPHIQAFTSRGDMPATLGVQMRQLPLYTKLEYLPPFR